MEVYPIPRVNFPAPTFIKVSKSEALLYLVLRETRSLLESKARLLEFQDFLSLVLCSGSSSTRSIFMPRLVTR